MAGHFVIGTRGSPLAQAQTNLVADALREAAPGLSVETRIIHTSGDANRDRPLPEIGGKGLFTLELERALLSGEIDAAAHSLKDLPTTLPDRLTVGAVPKRANPFDALISASGARLSELPDGARVGTSSLRRAAQLKSIRPDLRIESIRGNIDTRIRKLRDGGWGAIVLAAAGLERLDRADEITETFDIDIMLPAAGQGALGIEIREDDARARALVGMIHDGVTGFAVQAERAFLHALGGGCHVPVAAYAAYDPDSSHTTLTGLVLKADGSKRHRRTRTGFDPATVGAELAKELIEQGARETLEELEA